MYKVLWVLILFVSDPCPSTLIKDEFGRYVNKGISCAAVHGHNEYEKHFKIFHNKDSALQFYIKLESSRNQKWFGSDKIDSIQFINQ